jgi:FKBP-type peptidyl-prolyl cis-trans isomerase 2
MAGLMKKVLAAALIAVALSACASTTATKKTALEPAAAAVKGTVVKAGDEVEAYFTCRLENGEVAASTYVEGPGDPPVAKAAIFVPRAAKTPVTLVAGKEPVTFDKWPFRGFEGEIMYQLSQAIVGLSAGERHSLAIRAEGVSEPKEGDHLINISRVRQRAREMRLTPEEYKERTGREAEVGQEVTYEPALPGRVESVSQKEVLVRFTGEPGKEVKTPFGKGTIRETAEGYEIAIDARPGTLVRSGKMVGRITRVTDRDITIDYSHPFGTEPLLCDVLVEPLNTAGVEGTRAKETITIER